MQDLFEILVPLIFIGIGLLGKFLENKGQQEPPPDESELAERRRRIQEEISRKIAERGNGPMPDFAPPPKVHDDYKYDPNLPDSMQRRRIPMPEQQPMPPLVSPMEELFGPIAPKPAERPAPPLTTQRRPQPIFEPTKPAFDYAAELLKKKEAARIARLEAEAAKLETQRKLALNQAKHIRGHKTVGHSKLREAVFDSLSDPYAARKAILLQEIVGTPVGLREEGAMRPLWMS